MKRKQELDRACSRCLQLSDIVELYICVTCIIFKFRLFIVIHNTLSILYIVEGCTETLCTKLYTRSAVHKKALYKVRTITFVYYFVSFSLEFRASVVVYCFVHYRMHDFLNYLVYCCMRDYLSSSRVLFLPRTSVAFGVRRRRQRTRFYIQGQTMCEGCFSDVRGPFRTQDPKNIPKSPRYENCSHFWDIFLNIFENTSICV